MTGRRDAGVALLELMIALLVMAMMAVAIAAMLRTLGQGGQRINAGHTQFEVALKQDRVIRWAEGLPPTLQTDEPLLRGTSDLLVFHTIDTSGLVWPGAPLRVTINISPDGVIAVPQGQEASGMANKDQTPLVLAPGASGLAIRYWGAADKALAPGWSTRWDAAPRLPTLIRIDWTRSDGQAGVPLMLEPGLDARYNVRSLSSPVPPG